MLEVDGREQGLSSGLPLKPALDNCDLAWLWFHLKQSGMLCLVLFSHYHCLGSFLLHITFYLFFKQCRQNANRDKILDLAAKPTTFVKLL